MTFFDNFGRIYLSRKRRENDKDVNVSIKI